jgi:hypothetical protein
MSFDPYTHDLKRAGRALAGQTLLAVPDRARDMLRQGLLEAIAGPLDLWERTPAGSHRVPPFNIQHAGAPRFRPDALREQTLKGWHRLVGIELRLAAQVLEALLVAENTAVYQALLAEQCARVGQLYCELRRRAGEAWALTLLHWELRLLRYRASPVVAPLIYG